MFSRYGYCLAAVLLLVSAQNFGHAQNFWQQSFGPVSIRVKALVSTGPGVVIAGTDGVFGSGAGVLRTTDNGITWEQANVGLLDHEVLSLLATGSGRLFAGASNLYDMQGCCLYRSSDGGDAWEESQGGLSGALVTYALAEDSTGDLYSGTGLYGVHRSTDGGSTWAPTTPPWPGVWAEALAVNGEGMLFMATLTNGGVYRSTDKGQSWAEKSTGLSSGMPLITSLAVKPGGVMFAGMGYGGGVYRSTDNGDLWTRTSLNSGDVRALALAPNGTLFVGTFEKGVFWTTDDGESWQQDNSGLPQYWVWSLVVSPDGYVFAGTDSGGIFRSVQPVTSVENGRSPLPTSFVLEQNYPNPFNPGTTVRYALPAPADVRLSLYDALGREVAVLVDGPRDAGVHEIAYDASALSSGVLFYRMTANNITLTRMMTLLR